MTTKRRTTTRAALALALAGAAALAIGLGSSRGASGGTTRLHFLLRESVIPRDEGAKGPSDFERVIYKGPLLDPKSRKAVGQEIGACTIVDVRTEIRSVCQFVFTPTTRQAMSFADQISGSTVFDDVQSSRPQLTSITGGTGRYAGARGQIMATEKAGGLIDLVFELKP